MERNILNTSAGVLAVVRLLLLVAACITSGCLGAHGSFTYIAAGRILDSSDGQPLVGLRLTVLQDPEDRFDPAKEPAFWPGWQHTDADGRFAVPFPAGSFTTYMFMGIIPIGSPPSVGPPLGAMCVYVEKEGVWSKKKIRLDQDSQMKVAQGMRHIQIGDIVLEPAAE